MLARQVGQVFVGIALCLCFSITFAGKVHKKLRKHAKINTNLDWWEAATFYQIYPQSFVDSDGDGVGDLKGIIRRGLDYIDYIGVDAIWISPIYKSPMADNGYDVSDFYDIDPIYGTLGDFIHLVKKAHRLGIKILMDFIPNHSSDECKWFLKSIRREPGYEDFYVWHDGKIDENTGARIPPNRFDSIFGGSAWTWNDQRQQYYLHQFGVKQPDFNLENPLVRERLKDILKFWLDLGVDGFRADAIVFYFEKRLEDGSYPDNPPNTLDYQMNQPGINEILYEWREFLDQYTEINGGDTRVMLGEVYGNIDGVKEYMSDGDRRAGIHMPMNLNVVYVGNEIDAKLFDYWAHYFMDVIWPRHKMLNWVFANHDNPRIATRMGYNRVDLMTILLHGMPGASVNYYGEEIGMNDWDVECTRDCDSRDKARTPMQWDASRNAGFSKGNSTWLAVNPNYKIINVHRERKMERSTLNIFKKMVKLKKTPAFRAFKRYGAFTYGAWNDKVFHVMRTDRRTEKYRIIVNFGDKLEHVKGLSNETMEYVVLNSYSPHEKRAKVDLSTGIFLMPYEAVVLRRKLHCSHNHNNFKIQH